jgi:hypothetical protein
LDWERAVSIREFNEDWDWLNKVVNVEDDVFTV